MTQIGTYNPDVDAVEFNLPLTDTLPTVASDVAQDFSTLLDDEPIQVTQALTVSNDDPRVVPAPVGINYSLYGGPYKYDPRWTFAIGFVPGWGWQLMIQRWNPALGGGMFEPVKNANMLYPFVAYVLQGVGIDTQHRPSGGEPVYNVPDWLKTLAHVM